MRERARIAQFFAPLAAGEPGSFGLGDDAAQLTTPPGHTLIITTDSVIEGIHVLAGATPEQFAQKLLRRNLSDLAAMGAMPWRYSLNLHTPRELPDDWFAEFAATLAAEQAEFGMVLVGGDSTSGGEHIHTTLTCFGLMEGSALRRNGARPGDDIYVSGTIGDAALGLKLLQQNPATISPLVERYHLPEPRLALGQALCGIATAAMDISDGLMADLAQLCAASSVGATIMRDAIPHSEALQHFLDADASIWNLVLNGGDDYELLFTAPPEVREAITALASSLALPLTRIGTITGAPAIALLDANNQPLDFTPGWDHS